MCELEWGGDVGAPSSSGALFRPAEGRRACSPPASQVGPEQRQEVVFQSWQLTSEVLKAYLIHLASVCVNSFDDLALGGPQESPQVGFETLSRLPGLVRLCPLLIVLTLGTSRLCIPSGGSSLPPQIREADYANSNSTFFFFL